MSEQITEFDINQPFVTQEQKFKYWEESKAHIKEANKRIDALESEVADLKISLQLMEDVDKQSFYFRQQLQASNNTLREALEVVFNNIELFKSMWMRVPPFGDKVNKATRQAISEATSPIFIAFNETQKALSATPSESLQAK